jgi:hypothetical protein
MSSTQRWAGGRAESAAQADASPHFPATIGRFDVQRRRAFDLLDAGRLANAFALQLEDPKVRGRYGPHIFGQTLLLANEFAYVD